MRGIQKTMASLSGCNVAVTKRRGGSSAQNGRAASEPGVQRIPKRHFCLSTALATCFGLATSLAFVFLHHLHWSCLHHLLEHSKNQGSRKTNTGNPLITFGR